MTNVRCLQIPVQKTDWRDNILQRKTPESQPFSDTSSPPLSLVLYTPRLFIVPLSYHAFPLLSVDSQNHLPEEEAVAILKLLVAPQLALLLARRQHANSVSSQLQVNAKKVRWIIIVTFDQGICHESFVNA